MGRPLLLLACLACGAPGARASEETCDGNATCSDSEDGSLMQVKKRGVPAVPHSASDPNGCSGIYLDNNNKGVNIGDVWGAGNPSKEACQGECSRYGSGCRGWTWTGGKCYLKSQVCGMEYDQYVYSGYCYPWDGTPYGSSCGGSPTPPSPSPPPGPSGSCSEVWLGNNNNGQNLNSNPEPNCYSANDCKSRCGTAHNCKGWTWVSGQCWLKSVVGCMAPATGYDYAESGYCDPWWGPDGCGYKNSRNHQPR